MAESRGVSAGMSAPSQQVYGGTTAAASPGSSTTVLGDFTREEKDAIDKCLRLHLSSDYIVFRQQGGGPGGSGQVAYIEGWRAIELANETFGFAGWTSTVQDVSIDFVDQTPDGKFYVGASAIVRITLKNGVFHEDVGYGQAENVKSKGGALEKAKKEAITDAIKRTLRHFGNSLGNSVYDKDYTKAVLQRQTSASVQQKQQQAQRIERLFNEENNRRPGDMGPRKFMTTPSTVWPSQPPMSGASTLVQQDVDGEISDSDLGMFVDMQTSRPPLSAIGNGNGNGNGNGAVYNNGNGNGNGNGNMYGLARHAH